MRLVGWALVAGVAGAAAAVACGGPEKGAAAPTQDGGYVEDPDAASAALAEIAAYDTDGAAPEEIDGAPPPPPKEADVCQPASSAFEKLNRPLIKACYRDGKKKDPNLEGSVRIIIDVNPAGKAAIRVADGATLPKPVVACMLKAVKGNASKFEAGDCKHKVITLPIDFPTK